MNDRSRMTGIEVAQAARQSGIERLSTQVMPYAGYTLGGQSLLGRRGAVRALQNGRLRGSGWEGTASHSERKWRGRMPLARYPTR